MEVQHGDVGGEAVVEVRVVAVAVHIGGRAAKQVEWEGARGAVRGHRRLAGCGGSQSAGHCRLITSGDHCCHPGQLGLRISRLAPRARLAAAFARIAARVPQAHADAQGEERADGADDYLRVKGAEGNV